MSKFAEVTVGVVRWTGSAVLCTFNEATVHEEELWVPLSLIEDHKALEEEDEDGNVTIGIAKWFLQKNEIEV